MEHLYLFNLSFLVAGNNNQHSQFRVQSKKTVKMWEKLIIFVNCVISIFMDIKIEGMSLTEIQIKNLSLAFCETFGNFSSSLFPSRVIYKMGKTTIPT